MYLSIAIASRGQDLGDLQEKVKNMLPGMRRKKKKENKKNHHQKILLPMNVTQNLSSIFLKGISYPKARFSFTFFCTVSSFRLNARTTQSYSAHGFVLYVIS